MKMERVGFPVQRVAAQALVSDELATATLSSEYDQMMRATVLRLEAQVLAGGEHEVSVTANTYTVQSVWAAICVFWFKPMFAWIWPRLSERHLPTFRGWFIRLEIWADAHKTECTATETRKVPYRMCPHIKAPNSQHVEFLLHDTEGFYR